MEHAELQEIKAEVREMFPDVEWPEITRQPLWYGMSAETLVSEKTALVCNYKGKETMVYTPSNNYSVLYPEVLVHKMVALAKNSPQFGQPEFLRPKIYADGAKILFTVKFPEYAEKVRIAGREEKYNRAWRAGNSCDGTRAAWVADWLYRFICGNGMVSGRREIEFTARHSGEEIISAENLMAALQERTEDISELLGLYKKWASIELTGDDFNPFWNEFPVAEKHKQEILALPQTGTGIKLSDFIETNEVENAEGKKELVYAVRKPFTVFDLSNSVSQYFEHGKFNSDAFQIENQLRTQKAIMRRWN